MAVGFLLRAPRSQRAEPQAANQSPGARTAVAATGELVRSLRIGGTVETLRSAAIQAPELRGSHVVGWAVLTLVRLAEAGDVVAEFELKRLEDHIAGLQSHVTQAQATLRKRRIAVQGLSDTEALIGSGLGSGHEILAGATRCGTSDQAGIVHWPFRLVLLGKGTDVLRTQSRTVRSHG